MTDAPLPRRFERHPSRGWVAGLCAGLADYTGVPVVLIRLVVVLLSAWRLTGVVAYLLVWAMVPLPRERREAPGLDAHARQGLRQTAVVKRDIKPRDLAQAGALALVGGAALWLVQALQWGLEPYWLIMGLFAASGLTLAWTQADRASTRGIERDRGPFRWLNPLLRHWTTIMALVVALLLLAVAVILAVIRLPFGDIARALVGIVVATVVLAAASAPWLMRVQTALNLAREDRLVADARADMAAHLHDSVLQTLALIQRRAANPVEVVRLARRQERELRAWLYGEEPMPTSLAAAVRHLAQTCEDAYPIQVEVVTVGDIAMTPELVELVKAAGEAITNAAKHSGADTVAVYAEVLGDEVGVYVRDRGRGFDQETVDPDRLGLRRSILERVERHGGTARVRSAPGEGTEISLEMKA